MCTPCCLTSLLKYLLNSPVPLGASSCHILYAHCSVSPRTSVHFPNELFYSLVPGCCSCSVLHLSILSPLPALSAHLSFYSGFRCKTPWIFTLLAGSGIFPCSTWFMPVLTTAPCYATHFWKTSSFTRGIPSIPHAIQCTHKVVPRTCIQTQLTLSISATQMYLGI